MSIGIYIMSNWLSLPNSSNTYKQIYLNGFVDVSGGSIITRGPTDHLSIGGDLSVNGTSYLGNSLYIGSDGRILPGNASNGATYLYDISGTAFNGALPRPDISGTSLNGAIPRPDISGTPYNWAVPRPSIAGTALNGATIRPDISGTALNGAQLMIQTYTSQKGGDIDGEAAGDQSGFSVSISADGLSVAIGSIYNDGTTGTTDDNRGHVRVYQYRTISEDEWNTLDNSANQLRDNTNTLPILITGGDVAWSSTKSYWVQVGGDIDGEAVADGSGYSVSLNTDGTILAVGAIYNDGTSGTSDDNRGSVRVYQYRTVSQDEWNTLDNSSNQIYDNRPILITGGDTTWGSTKKYWVQMGGDIDGEMAGDQSSYSVQLNSDGYTVAIGAINNDGTSNTDVNIGQVRVYQYRNITSTEWESLLNVSNQVYTNKPIIITTGDIEWDAAKKYWVQMGGEIDGETPGDQSGISMSLSSDGTVVAIGCKLNDGTTTDANNNRGHVRIYKYKDISQNEWNTLDNSSNQVYTDKPILITGGDVAWTEYKKYWVQMGGDIDGEAAGAQAGTSVSLSSDGQIVAIGSYLNDGTSTDVDNNCGNVRVYQYRTVSEGEWNTVFNRVDLIYDGSANKKPILITGGDLTWNSTKKYWVQLGGDIDGEINGDQFGSAVKLSADGTILAVGAPFNDGTFGSDRGHVRLYQYRTVAQSEWNYIDNSSNLTYDGVSKRPVLITGGDTTWTLNKLYWVQFGEDVDAELVNSGAGMSISLSSNGRTVAVGAYLNDGTTGASSDNRGHVRVYDVSGTNFYYLDVSGGYYDISNGYYDVSNGYYDISGGFYDVSGYTNGRTSASLFVNGDIDLSGDITLRNNVSVGNETYISRLFVSGDCSINGTISAKQFVGAINANMINSSTDISFMNRLFVARSDISINTSNLTVATDFSLNNTRTALANNLIVPANIAIIDGSNNTVYGSYITFTNKDATAYYNMGKTTDTKNQFNIVDPSSIGVYIGSGGTSFASTSDGRLKTNIVPLSSATEKIMALNPCTYQWKAELETAAEPTVIPNRIGFIAQEVEQVLPEVVHPIDHPNGPDYKGVNTTDMIPFLVRTLQEQTERISALQARLKELKKE